MTRTRLLIDHSRRLQQRLSRRPRTGAAPVRASDVSGSFPAGWLPQRSEQSAAR